MLGLDPRGDATQRLALELDQHRFGAPAVHHTGAHWRGGRAARKRDPLNLRGTAVAAKDRGLHFLPFEQAGKSPAGGDAGPPKDSAAGAPPAPRPPARPGPAPLYHAPPPRPG